EPSAVAPNPVTAQPDRASAERALRGEPVAREVFTGLPDRYDRLAYLLSLGQDRRWRRAVVDRAATGLPRRALDVATGPAGIALAVAGRTGADVVGGGLNEPMLRAGLPRIRRPLPRGRVPVAPGPFPRGGVRGAGGPPPQLPFHPPRFAAAPSSSRRRSGAAPAATTAEMARCLRPGGTLACLEFHVPPQPAWRAAWWCYTRLALPVLGSLTGGPAWYRVGRFLGPSISGHYGEHPLAWHVAAWRAAGLTEGGAELLRLGGGLVTWGRKGPAS